jgi:hypothetical protein
VAERSGDTSFRLRIELSKRRGASLPAAVQKVWLRCRNTSFYKNPPQVDDWRNGGFQRELSILAGYLAFFG